MSKTKLKLCFLLISIFSVSVFLLCYGGKIADASMRPLPGDCAVKIEFTYGGRRWKFCDDITYDKNDAELIRELTRRGHFLTVSEKKQRIDEIISLNFTQKQAADLVLAGLHDFTKGMMASINKAATDSVISFNPDSEELFYISEEKLGLSVDEKKLYALIVNGLGSSGKLCVTVPVSGVQPQVTKVANQKNISLKSVFSTTYSNSSSNRKNNIRLSASKFNGLRIKPGGEVSFNKTVGPRTEANGFEESKIILDGKYQDGVGGGVCQSSTTLYNAAILAGLKIKEWHRHSLPCNYTAASFDAMVSSTADLIFVNDTEHDIFIKTQADGKQIKVWIYGAPNEFEIVRESEIIRTIDAETEVVSDEKGEYSDKVFYEDEQFYLTRPINGVESKGYLNFYKEGQLVARKHIRNDIYKPQTGVIVKGANKRPPNPQITNEEQIRIDEHLAIKKILSL